jgi:hypothetical protein
MSEALAEFAAWADPCGVKLLAVVVDNAGAHTAKALVIPSNVRLVPLPSCTPELQPAERLWPLVRESVANRTFDHLVGLAAKLRGRCDYLSEHPEIVQGAVGYHWHPFQHVRFFVNSPEFLRWQCAVDLDPRSCVAVVS